MIWIYDNEREFDNAIEGYYKKFHKIIGGCDVIGYDDERGEYIYYTDSTQYSMTSKRLK